MACQTDEWDTILIIHITKGVVPLRGHGRSMEILNKYMLQNTQSV